MEGRIERQSMIRSGPFYTHEIGGRSLSGFGRKLYEVNHKANPDELAPFDAKPMVVKGWTRNGAIRAAYRRWEVSTKTVERRKR